MHRRRRPPSRDVRRRSPLPWSGRSRSTRPVLAAARRSGRRLRTLCGGRTGRALRMISSLLAPRASTAVTGPFPCSFNVGGKTRRRRRDLHPVSIEAEFGAPGHHLLPLISPPPGPLAASVRLPGAAIPQLDGVPIATLRTSLWPLRRRVRERSQALGASRRYRVEHAKIDAVTPWRRPARRSVDSSRPLLNEGRRLGRSCRWIEISQSRRHRALAPMGRRSPRLQCASRPRRLRPNELRGRGREPSGCVHPDHRSWSRGSGR